MHPSPLSSVPAVSRPTRYPRRDALRIGGLAVAALAAAPALTSLAACADDRTPEIDALRGPVDDARRDAALATRLAAQSPERAEVLTVIAAQRTGHAEALTAEIERISPQADQEPVADQDPYPPLPGEDAETLTGFLRESAAAAQALTVSSAGYRAGLLGAIAASCTAEAEVLSL